LNRLFLHASEIEFMDPETQKKVNFSSPIPTDLADILN
jgi:23S rRNA-/tRNA-specific pseudouridylate synthase